MKIIFRTDADEQLGFGHLKRCMALADGMRTEFEGTEFVLRSCSQEARNLLGKSKLDYSIVEKRNEIDLLGQYGRDSIVVFDVCHGLTVRSPETLVGTISSLKEEQVGTAIIDGLGRYELSATEELRSDFTIIPYGYENQILKEHLKGGICFRLLGPQFFIFQDEYVRVYRKQTEQPEQVENLLLTFGGSDPRRLTPVAMDAVERVCRDCLIRVVIGPGFDDPLRSQIERGADRSGQKNRYELLESPSSLADWMVKSDLAIAASGLTKYELALLGVPSILISTDTEHAKITDEFAKKGSAIHAGEAKEGTREKLEEFLRTLVTDQKARQSMAEDGQKMTVDPFGVDRIKNEFQEWYGRK